MGQPIHCKWTNPLVGYIVPPLGSYFSLLLGTQQYTATMAYAVNTFVPMDKIWAMPTPVQEALKLGLNTVAGPRFS